MTLVEVVATACTCRSSLPQADFTHEDECPKGRAWAEYDRAQEEQS